MNIVFMGTPDFAVPALEKLIERYNVKAVFTQPDRPKGRGKKLSKSAVKETAEEFGVDVYQPEKLRNDKYSLEIIKSMCPDFIVVVAYGQILSREVLDIPKYGCVNLHASILPKYRGAAPINWCIIDGEKETGNTTMLMNEGLDTGDILLTSRVEIGDNVTAGELHDVLMEDGAGLLVRTLDGVLRGEIHGKKQGESPTQYAGMLDKHMANINWQNNAADIKNFIRGLNPWPAARTIYKGSAMKIYEAAVTEEKSSHVPGFIEEVSDEGIKVCTGDKIILIDKIQFPGKKVMKIKEYIRGNSIECKSVLGQ
jgi:methionyl-tRNA formyltransferase